ncbi:MAG: hypothetical protein ACRD21_22730 [Vicinamibacteria bacterium]
MIFFSRKHLSKAALGLSMSLFAPPSLWAQSVVSAGDERITIDAESVSLGTFFEELSRIVPVEILVLAPDVKEISVSLQLSEVHPVVGVHEVLEEAEVDYAVSGGDGKPFRIIVGALGDARLSALAEGEPPESDTEEPDAGYHEDGSPLEGETFPEQQGGRGSAGGIAGIGASGTGPRSATGMASPSERGAGQRPGAPGALGPAPRRPGGQGPASQPRRRSPSIVTGGGFIATGSAALNDGPAESRVAAAGGVLALGLTLGLFLVRRTGE